MATDTVAEIVLIAVRTAEVDPPLGIVEIGRIEAIAAFGAGPGRDVPKWIVARSALQEDRASVVLPGDAKRALGISPLDNPPRSAAGTQQCTRW